jgi:alkanesulfonate monooxygenase SsuD/methylene tetrahydromethanopterin reductase-like flavin-dependent oxidoreductase (luciferase family)
MRAPGDRIPVYLAAIGPNNLRLTGEIADGWLGVFCAPEHLGEQLALIAEGRRGDMAGFDVTASVPVVIGDEPAACADAVRAYTALYVGGMGSARRNFYNDLVTRMGFGDAAREVQRLYLDGHQRDAAAALPAQLLDRTALLGPVDRVAEGLRRYASAGVTTVAALLVGEPSTAVRTLRQLAEALERSGIGG